MLIAVFDQYSYNKIVYYIDILSLRSPSC